MCPNTQPVRGKDIILYTAAHAGLARDFVVNPSSCENPDHYSNFIRTTAVSDRMLGMGVTYMLCETVDGEPVNMLGYVTLKAASLLMADDGNGYPALEIAELAVRNGSERMGHGKALVDFAIVTADKLRTNSLGICYVVVMSDSAAVNFYKKACPAFAEIGDWYAIPHELWNKTCVGLYLKLPALDAG